MAIGEVHQQLTPQLSHLHLHQATHLCLTTHTHAPLTSVSHTHSRMEESKAARRGNVKVSFILSFRSKLITLLSSPTPSVLTQPDAPLQYLQQSLVRWRRKHDKAPAHARDHAAIACHAYILWHDATGGAFTGGTPDEQVVATMMWKAPDGKGADKKWKTDKQAAWTAVCIAADSMEERVEESNERARGNNERPVKKRSRGQGVNETETETEALHALSTSHLPWPDNWLGLHILHPVNKQERERIPGVDEYEIVSKIGQGSSGNVYWCQRSKSTEPVAIKLYNDEEDSEAELFQIINWPFFIDAVGDNAIRMKMLGVSLCCMQKVANLAPIRVASIVQSVCTDLSVLHKLGICHADVKPHNIAWDPRDRRFVLFDMSVYASDCTAGFNRNGTPMFMAPEQLDWNRAHYRSLYPQHATTWFYRADVWQLGVTIAWLLRIYRDQYPGELFCLTNTHDRVLSEMVAVYMGRTREERRLWLFDRVSLPTEALRHAAVDMLMHMLVEVEDRWDIQEVVGHEVWKMMADHEVPSGQV